MGQNATRVCTTKTVTALDRSHRRSSKAVLECQITGIPGGSCPIGCSNEDRIRRRASHPLPEIVPLKIVLAEVAEVVANVKRHVLLERILVLHYELMKLSPYVWIASRGSKCRIAVGMGEIGGYRVCVVDAELRAVAQNLGAFDAQWRQ